jgi:hypothetical protein
MNRGYSVANEVQLMLAVLNLLILAFARPVTHQRSSQTRTTRAAMGERNLVDTRKEFSRGRLVRIGGIA